MSGCIAKGENAMRPYGCSHIPPSLLDPRLRWGPQCSACYPCPVTPPKPLLLTPSPLTDHPTRHLQKVLFAADETHCASHPASFRTGDHSEHPCTAEQVSGTVAKRLLLRGGMATKFSRACFFPAAGKSSAAQAERVRAGHAACSLTGSL
ncbi:hypothetical protein SRHO_G00106510 [Serrasalmus rhombeus]